MLGAEPFPGDEPGTLDGSVPTGDLRREGQKKLIQAFFGEKIPHQPRSAFDKEDFAGKEAADRGKNRPRADRAPFFRFPEDEGGGKPRSRSRQAPSGVVTIRTVTAPDRKTGRPRSIAARAVTMTFKGEACVPKATLSRR